MAGKAVYQGWVLKKRRKKMQGFARRYFILYDSGVLSYSFEPAKPSRDEIQLQQATISSSRNTREFHVDSNTATFHIKCLSTQDFEGWMTAFRQFIVSSNDPRALGRKSSVSRAQSRMGQVTKTSTVVDEMGLTLANLERAVEDLPAGDHTKRTGSRTRDGAAKFALFGKKPHHSHSNPSTPPDEKDNPHNDALERVHTALNALKMEHLALVKLVASLSSADLNAPPPSIPAVAGSPLPMTTEEEGDRAPTPKNARPLSYRNSFAASISDSASEWFDAPDGAEAYELDAQDSESQSPESGGSRMTRTDSHTSVSGLSDTGEMEGSDTEDESEEPVAKPELIVKPSASSKQIVRRTQLPSGPVGEEGSMFSVLKKNIGKDLSSIALPVTFNEPLTLLQRAAEEVEYYDLLSQAVHTQDPIEQMCYVAAFAVSGYAHTRHRSSRKGLYVCGIRIEK